MTDARTALAAQWREWLESFGNQSRSGIQASGALAEIARLEAMVADSARVGRSQGVTLSATMLLEALEFIAPDRATDKDQLDTEVAIAWRDATPKDPAGYYAWLAEYPEEGAIPIGTSDADGTETSDGGDEPSEERKQNPLGLKLSLTCCKCDQPATIHGGRSYCRDHDPDMGVSI